MWTLFVQKLAEFEWRIGHIFEFIGQISSNAHDRNWFLNYHFDETIYGNPFQQFDRTQL